MLLTQPEFASVLVAVGPLVLAEALGPTLSVLARVHVTVREKVGTVSVPQARGPLTLVPIAVEPGVDPVPLSLAVDPLPDVTVSVDSLPDAVALLLGATPLAIVDLPISPGVGALSFRLALSVVALVGITVAEKLIASSMSLVCRPFSLIDASGLIHDDSFALPLPPGVDLTTKNGILVLLYDEVRALLPQEVVVKEF